MIARLIPTKLLKDRKAREKLEDRIELGMAIIVIAAFILDKIVGDDDEEDPEETSEASEWVSDSDTRSKK